MPWSNKGGGWRGSGGNGGGPWGQGPSGGPSGQQPDLEEILRRGQDRLKQALPSGGGNRLMVPIILIVLALGWFSQAVYQVEPNELGVELLFGKPKDQISEPGLQFIMWPIESVEIVSISQVREAVGSFRTGRTTTGGRDQSLMLSGDQNIVDVDFTVLWRVADPKKFLFNVRQPDDFVRRVAESAMREYIGRSRADAVRTEQRAALEDTVRSLIQSILETYNAGIAIVGVQLERADPPPDVADAFEEVQRAQQDQDKFKQEAQAYANKRLGEARGEAARIREEAKGYKESVVAQAQGEAARFNSVLAEYEKAKQVTRERLFLETMEKVLGRANKVIVQEGAGGSGVVPYLPLPEVAKRQQGGAQQ